MESVIDFGRSCGNVHSHSHLQNDSLMGFHRGKGLLREVLWESAAAGVLLLASSMCMCVCVCVLCPVVTAWEFKRLKNGHFPQLSVRLRQASLCVYLMERLGGAGCVGPLSAGEAGFQNAYMGQTPWRCCPLISSLPLVCLQGKRLPAYLSADAEEGEVSDDDSADEIEDDFKLKSSNVRIIHQCNVTHCLISFTE